MIPSKIISQRQQEMTKEKMFSLLFPTDSSFIPKWFLPCIAMLINISPVFTEEDIISFLSCMEANFFTAQINVHNVGYYFHWHPSSRAKCADIYQESFSMDTDPEVILRERFITPHALLDDQCSKIIALRKEQVPLQKIQSPFKAPRSTQQSSTNSQTLQSEPAYLEAQYSQNLGENSSPFTSTLMSQGKQRTIQTDITSVSSAGSRLNISTTSTISSSSSAASTSSSSATSTPIDFSLAASAKTPLSFTAHYNQKNSSQIIFNKHSDGSAMVLIPPELLEEQPRLDISIVPHAKMHLAVPKFGATSLIVSNPILPKDQPPLTIPEDKMVASQNSMQTFANSTFIPDLSPFFPDLEPIKTSNPVTIEYRVVPVINKRTKDPHKEIWYSPVVGLLLHNNELSCNAPEFFKQMSPLISLALKDSRIINSIKMMQHGLLPAGAVTISNQRWPDSSTPLSALLNVPSFNEAIFAFNWVAHSKVPKDILRMKNDHIRLSFYDIIKIRGTFFINILLQQPRSHPSKRSNASRAEEFSSTMAVYAEALSNDIPLATKHDPTLQVVKHLRDLLQDPPEQNINSLSSVQLNSLMAKQAPDSFLIQTTSNKTFIAQAPKSHILEELLQGSIEISDHLVPSGYSPTKNRVIPILNQNSTTTTTPPVKISIRKDLQSAKLTASRILEDNPSPTKLKRVTIPNLEEDQEVIKAANALTFLKARHERFVAIKDNGRVVVKIPNAPQNSTEEEDQEIVID